MPKSTAPTALLPLRWTSRRSATAAPADSTRLAAYPRPSAASRSGHRSVLALYLRKRHLVLPDALAYMHEAEDLLAGHEYEVPSAPVLQLSMESGYSAYDCEFVHLAQVLDVPLVSSDRRVLKAFPEVAVAIEDFA